MDTLKNKSYTQYDYRSRYATIPHFYDTVRNREMYGVGRQIDKNIVYVTHKLDATDTLDSLALKYYNNPTLWWAIAYFNGITDAFQPLLKRFTLIKIPNISSITFKDER